MFFLLLSELSNKNGTHTNNVVVPRRQRVPLPDARPLSTSGNYATWRLMDRGHPYTTPNYWRSLSLGHQLMAPLSAFPSYLQPPMENLPLSWAIDTMFVH